MMHRRALDSGLLGRGAATSPGFTSVRNIFEPLDSTDHHPGVGGYPAPGGSQLALPGPDDAGILLEQLRRRSARKSAPPGAPHPELTPQQKQHIIERSSSGLTSPNAMSYTSQGFPLRRFLSGGSVAERVMIFERCPVFNQEPGGGASPAPRLGENRALLDKGVNKEPPSTMTSSTTWRSTSSSPSSHSQDNLLLKTQVGRYSYRVRLKKRH